MTGAPEAALAREMRMCYAALALVTDMDAGAECGVGRRPGGGVRAVPGEPRAADRAARPPRSTALPDPDGLHLLDLGRRHRADLRGAREGPAHRLGRLHRHRRRRGPRGGRPRGGPGRPHAADGARRRPSRRRAPTTSTCATPAAWVDLLRGVDAVCHQAAVVGAGVRVGDLPEYAGHNDLGTAALLAAMHEAGVDRLVLASSMVVYGEGRYPCPEHGDQTPPPRDGRRARGRRLRQPLPALRPPARTGRWSTRTRGSTRARRTPPARSPRSTTPPRGCARPARRAVALRYHNVYGPGMPRDTPYSGVAAMFRSSLERGEPPQVFEDGGQVRDFVHVADVARANLRGAAGGDRTTRRRRYAAYNVASGHPVSILDVATLVARGHRPRHRARGDRRLPARRRPARRGLAGAGRAPSSASPPRCPRAGAAGLRDRAAAADHAIRLRYDV